MTTILYAQPYDISAEGFYFRTVKEYDQQRLSLKNDYGDPVEEFEIQFIDGEHLDCELAKAIGINQADFPRYFEIIDEWDDQQKLAVIIAVGECGYQFEDNTDPDDFDIEIYKDQCLRGLALQFVDEGFFGDIPDSIQFYIDYAAIARDLAVDYVETTIAGGQYVYCCR
ncbi:antirestriction protein ArdA [Maritalea sp.]|uniref:antirestriction protein ArdA n=1 Tax=Maritalea sp. TaxID=2003361 RepID=UPI003EF77677